MPSMFTELVAKDEIVHVTRNLEAALTGEQLFLRGEVLTALKALDIMNMLTVYNIPYTHII